MNKSLPSILLYLLLLAGVLLFVQQQVAKQKPADTSLTSETGQEPPPELVITAQQPRIEIHHQLKCDDPGQAIGERKTTTAYRWQDEQGQWHFSDKPQQRAEGFELHSQDKRYFTLNIEMIGNTDGQLDLQLRLAVEKAYRIIAQLLPQEALRQVAVSLKVFGDKTRYNRFREQYLGGQIAWADGFYHSADNTAAVLWINPRQAQAVALHESIHVINFGLVGIMPRWLNEGIAEYLENLQLYAQSVEIPLRPRQAMGKRLPAELRHVFQDNHPHWRNQGRVRLYQASWALTAFLMESPEGRRYLRDFMTALSKERCQSINSAIWFNQHYPGGVPALEQAVKQWLQQQQPALHRF